jgi:hypothetical protein
MKIKLLLKLGDSAEYDLKAAFTETNSREKKISVPGVFDLDGSLHAFKNQLSSF